MKYLFLAMSLLTATTLAAQQKKHKVLFIIADGIPADVIESQPSSPEAYSEGRRKYCRAYVGGRRMVIRKRLLFQRWVTTDDLLTSTWVNKHNVWDNDIAAQNYAYPSIFRFFKSAYPEKKTAIFPLWLDNRAKLVGDGLAQTGNLHIIDHAPVDGLRA